jgi:CelD/BcsL family acetyltransferase involved in cellulose biosynthesis/L-amino acid N-acyltransferase YncA
VEILEISQFDQLKDYKQQWNELLSVCYTNVIFQTFEFCESWWQTFGKNHELFVLLAKESDKIVGIAPFTISKTGIFGLKAKVLYFLGSSTVDYFDFIIPTDRKDVFYAVVDYLWQNRHKWDLVNLRQIPEQSITLNWLAKYLNDKKISCLFEDGIVRMAVLIKGYEEDLQKKLNGQHTLKKEMEKLSQTGSLAYKVLKTREETLPYIEALFQQHITRWKNTLSPSVFNNPTWRSFYLELAEKMVEKNWLHLSALDLNDTPLAMFLAFDYNGSLSVHKTSFDISYYDYSPDKLTCRYALQYCIDNHYRALDLPAGTEGYNGYITNSSRKTKNVKLFSCRIWEFVNTMGRKLRIFPLINLFFRESWLWRARMRFAKSIKLYGLKGSIKRVFLFYTSKVIGISRLQFSKWAGENLPEIVAGCQMSIRKGAMDDIELIAGFYGYSDNTRDVEKLREIIKNGSIPYLAFCGKTLVHIAWLAKESNVEIPEVESFAQIGAGHAYIYKCNTAESFRGKNIYPAVLQKIIEEVKKQGITAVYIACAKSNKASLRGILKAGFRPCMSVTTIKLLGWKPFKKDLTLD